MCSVLIPGTENRRVSSDGILASIFKAYPCRDELSLYSLMMMEYRREP